MRPRASTFLRTEQELPVGVFAYCCAPKTTKTTPPPTRNKCIHVFRRSRRPYKHISYLHTHTYTHEWRSVEALVQKSKRGIQFEIVFDPFVCTSCRTLATLNTTANSSRALSILSLCALPLSRVPIPYCILPPNFYSCCTPSAGRLSRYLLFMPPVYYRGEIE